MKMNIAIIGIPLFILFVVRPFASQECDLAKVDLCGFEMHFGVAYNFTPDRNYDDAEMAVMCDLFLGCAAYVKKYVEDCFDEGDLKTSLLAFVGKTENMQSLICTPFGYKQYADFGPCVGEGKVGMYAAYVRYIASLEAVAAQVPKEHLMHTACCFGEEYIEEFTVATRASCKETGAGVSLFFTSMTDLNLLPDGCHTMELDCQNIPDVDRSKTHVHSSVVIPIIEILTRKYS